MSKVLRYSTEHLTRRLFTVVLLLTLGACASAPGDRSEPPVREGEVVDVDAALAIPDQVALDYGNAQTLLSVEDYAGAVQILEPLAAAYPQYPAVATTLAIALRHLERSDDALATLETALVAHDTYAPGWNEVGILHREAGRFDEAEAAYLKAVTVSPDYALAHFNLGILLDLYLARHQEALEHYERYQSLQPEEDKQVKRWIADITRRIQRTTQAASVAR